jgi:hypothetical protein
MGEDARDATIHNCCHLRRRGSTLDESIDERRRPAAQYRLLATCQNRGEVMRLGARRAVAHAIHASMLPMEQTFLDPPPHSIPAQPRHQQLPHRHDAMLSGGNQGHLQLR